MDKAGHKGLDLGFELENWSEAGNYSGNIYTCPQNSTEMLDLVFKLLSEVIGSLWNDLDEPRVRIPPLPC